MTTQTKVAKPYAKAAFEYALAQDDIDAWQLMLNTLGVVIQQPKIKQYLKTRNETEAKKSRALQGLIIELVNQPRERFIDILAENHRLELLDEISILFNHLYSEHQKQIEAQVITVTPLNDEQKQQVTRALSKRLKKNVSIENVIDESLIAGTIIKAGDVVIDDSVRGKLSRLKESLNT